MRSYGLLFFLAACGSKSPNPPYVDREAISEATGYMKSTRNRYLQLLAARCITEESRDGLCAAAMLFES